MFSSSDSLRNNSTLVKVHTSETMTLDEENKDVPELSKKYGWGVRHIQMFCLSGTMLVLFMARSSMGIAVLAMTDQTRANSTDIMIFSWDKKTQGLILSSFFWGYVVMQIPGGLLSKRYGGKPVILVALMLNALICLLLPMMAEMGDWSLVCTARVAMGLTQACLFSTGHTLLGQWLPALERTTFSGTIYGGTKLGIIIGLPFYGFLAETKLGWKMIFYATAVILFVMTILWWYFAESTPAEHKTIDPAERAYIEKELLLSAPKEKVHIPWYEIVCCVPFWVILIVQSGFAVYFTFIFVDLPTYLEKGLGISTRNGALLSALPFIGMWVGNIVSTSVSDKLINKGIISVSTSRKLCNSIAFFGVSVGLLAISFIDKGHRNLAIVFMIASFSLEGFACAGFLVNHLDLSPNFGGVTFAITNTISQIFSILTPIAVSFILRNDPTDVGRWQVVFMCIASICIISNILYLIFSSFERQVWDDPHYKRNRILQDPEVTEPELQPVLQKEENCIKI